MAARASTASLGDPPDPPLFGSFRPSQPLPFPLVANRPRSGNNFQQFAGSSSGKMAAAPPGIRSRPIAPPRSFADVVKPRVVKASQDLHLFGNPKKQSGVKRFARNGIPVVSINNAVSSALAAPFRWTLVGKFSHGVPSFPQIRKFFDNLKLVGFVNIHRLSHTHFLIFLGEELDFVRVWLGKIWHVAGFPMRLFKWTPSFDTKFESALTPVWVRLPGLPAHLFDRGVLFELASSLGKPIRADSATALRVKFSEARFCVEVDLQLPRVDHIFLEIDGESRKQRVIYENLPVFCSFCQRVGHSVESCFKRLKGLKRVLGSKVGDEANEDGQLVCSSAVQVTGPAGFGLELAYSLFLEMVDRFFGGDRGVPRPPVDLFPFKWLRGTQVWVDVPGSGVGAGEFLLSQSVVASKSGECDVSSSLVVDVSHVESSGSSSGLGELAVVECVDDAGLHGVSCVFPDSVLVEIVEDEVIDYPSGLCMVQDDISACMVVDGDADEGEVRINSALLLDGVGSVAVDRDVSLEGVRDVSQCVSGDVSLVDHDVSGSPAAGGAGPPVLGLPVLGPSDGPVQNDWQPLAGPSPGIYRPLFLSQQYWPSNFCPVLRQTDFFGSPIVHANPLQTVYAEDFDSHNSIFENYSFGSDFGDDEDESVPKNYMVCKPSGPLSKNGGLNPVDSDHARLIEYSDPERRVTRSMSVVQAARQAGVVPFGAATLQPDFEVCAMDPALYLQSLRNSSRVQEQVVEDLEEFKTQALHRRAKSTSPRRSSRTRKKNAF